MDKDLLMRFCSEDDERTKTPIRIGEFIYYANGFICARVPASFDPAVLEEEGREKYRQAVLNLFSNPMPESSDWIRADSISFPEPIMCGECNGAGKDFECPECGGSGEVDFSNMSNDYTCDCKSCNGMGNIAVCNFCQGAGQTLDTVGVILGSAKVKINCGYIKLISKLDNSEILPTNKSGPNWFRFDGGVGKIMPMLA